MNNMQNGIDVPLFDSILLEDLDISNFIGSINFKSLQKCFKVRPLYQSDYEKGYINLLSQLTTVGDISFEQFSARFNAMKSCPDTYYITVIEDLKTKQVIGTATLVIEQKFIHSASSRGRIEDVVVSNEYRGQQLGKLLLGILVSQSKKLGCYKVSLECKTHLLPYYSQFGFVKEKDNNYMVLRYMD